MDFITRTWNSNPLTLISQGAIFCVAILNLGFLVRIQPLEARVQRIEERLEQVQSTVDDIQISGTEKSRVNEIRLAATEIALSTNNKEVKESLIRLENKIDALNRK